MAERQSQPCSCDAARVQVYTWQVRGVQDNDAAARQLDRSFCWPTAFHPLRRPATAILRRWRPAIGQLVHSVCGGTVGCCLAGVSTACGPTSPTACQCLQLFSQQ